ncbi:hypothetical protein [Vibrio gallaecicus]|nr:hypothetical protein [Vibrio gallaecicus]MDN3617637.1 hypothetical protein [Vibrio gallaecicus]
MELSYTMIRRMAAFYHVALIPLAILGLFNQTNPFNGHYASA